MDDMYVVTVDGPDGTQIRRVYSTATIRDLRPGPVEPHAKAAYCASIEIQAASDRDELDTASLPKRNTEE